MPTDQQIRASAGVDPITERVAKQLYVIHLDGRPSGVWEVAEHEVREGYRERADDWMVRSEAGAIGLVDFPAKAPGGLM